ncbi:urea amidolyase family protein [Microbacterium halotolerans]|uniref:5-oxoprolinase subunit B/C family protein n=1 Tax=Microbacterium halotolerans TaxID=246613 RepID=UPI000E6AA46C|nr:urea amidolyase family protein [Microbacterium halotolerans]
MMRFLPCGDDAVLVELPDLAAAVALARSLAARPVPGMIDAVPGARTVLVQLAPHADRDAVHGDLLTRAGSTHAPDDAETVEVGVLYDGEDLDEVAELTGLTPAEVVERHAAAVYEVAFTGFAPGFAYLSGLDPALHVPRRETPRQRIPAGAVAIAGEFSGVYPRSSPGGWRLLGRTPDAMWDIDRTPPALLRPGMRVRFLPLAPDDGGEIPVRGDRAAAADAGHSGDGAVVSGSETDVHDAEAAPDEAGDASTPDRVQGTTSPRRTQADARLGAPAARRIDGIAPDARAGRERRRGSTPCPDGSTRADHEHAASGAGAAPAGSPGGEAPEPSRAPAVEIVSVGPHALIEDLGRPGHADLGVAPSGAMDRGALRRANGFVGDPTDAAVIETALGGLRLLAHGHLTLAVAGAPVPLTIIRSDEERAATFDAPFALSDGEELVVGAAERGVYSYVAVRGGLEADVVLGSSSRDVLAGLGPEPLAAGSILPVGSRIAGAVDPWAAPAVPLATSGDDVWLDVVPGPREDWFSAAALAAFCDQDWLVSARSNRVGLRLEGEQRLERVREGELPSEGTVTGALQVPPDGQPILFTADRPLTGGYPVVGVVTRAHLGRAAQAPPGARIRFRFV